MTTIYIAAGHGGTDPGATYNNRNERDEAIKLVNAAVALASKHLAPNHRVVIIPHAMGYVETVQYFNRVAGSLDVLIEVHFNANAGTAGTGVETWYGLKPLAATLNEAVAKVMGLANRGIKYSDGFYVTRSAIAGGQKSGVILEMCFINNKSDMAVFDKNGVKALATGLVSVSRGKYTPLPTTTPVPKPVPVPPPVTTAKWRVLDAAGRQIGAYSTDAGAWSVYLKNRSGSIKDMQYKDVTAMFKEKYDPKPTPPVIVTPTPPDYDKENNAILKEILGLVKNIWNKITGVFK